MISQAILKPLQWKRVGSFLETAVGAGWSFHVYEHPTSGRFTATGPDGEIGTYRSGDMAKEACEHIFSRRVDDLFDTMTIA